jgi:hypothetical protein
MAPSHEDGDSHGVPERGVGLSVGATTPARLSVGLAVGCFVASAIGLVVGLELIGRAFGPVVGLTMMVAVGSDGLLVGLAVSPAVGLGVGLVVGFAIGFVVGFSVGFDIGFIVRTTVGLATGGAGGSSGNETPRLSKVLLMREHIDEKSSFGYRSRSIYCASSSSQQYVAKAGVEPLQKEHAKELKSKMSFSGKSLNPYIRSCCSEYNRTKLSN